jgi:hypothetical protein
MKRNAWIVCLACLMIMASSVSAQETTPIRTLGVAPWLGKIESQSDLTQKIFSERSNLIGYIIFDLERSDGIQLSHSEAEKIVAEMVQQQGREFSFQDGTTFKSMGWKSRAGDIKRTANPILRLGRPVQAFVFEISLERFLVQYAFLKECGNLCLISVTRADPVPPSTEPRAYAEQPPSRPAEPKIVYRYYGHPPPQVYWTPQPRVYYSAPRVYYSAPTVIYQRPRVPIRPPIVHTQPPVIRPPTVRTKSLSVYTR